MSNSLAKELLNKTRQNMFRSVDASSLVVFRIGFGLIMLWEVWRYWSYGWISKYYIEPDFQFKYFGFEWIEPWPGEWMYVHYAVVAALAFFITIGFLYRVSTHLFFLAFSYIFLLEQAHYLNHLYLVILVSFILCMVPANRYLAIDAWLNPEKKSDTVPAWSVWLLRAQFEVLYIYAGIVKLNGDWLQLEPLSMWLAGRSGMPVLGDLFMQDWSVAVAAYGIIILHMIGAPLLLWKRARIYVFLIYACFHTLNHFVFSIGIFPWLTLFATLIFFDPDWPKQVWRKLGALFGRKTMPRRETARSSARAEHNWLPGPVAQNFILGAIGLWLAYQVLMPLRHLLYPGNVSWTEEGHAFSWQMKLRDKRGEANFLVRDPLTDRTWRVNPEHHLTSRQARKMSTRPDMILQFAHYLADHWKSEYNVENAEVKVFSKVSLNGRKAVTMIDPSVDLSKIDRSLKRADWILPLNEPLNRSPEKYRSMYRAFNEYR
jgi:vitamin K-dependent gamma-carboxylase